MNYHLLNVQRTGLAADNRPRLQFCGDWLTEMGFVNGALVQSLPETDGLVFNLCDKNINYSDLYNATKEKGGKLNRAYISNTRTMKGLVFVTTGWHITKGGLQYGDNLVAKYEYGCIRVRKTGEHIHLFHVGNIKKAHTGESEPRIWLHGDWMNEIGFAPDTLVTVAAAPDCITFTACEKAVVYSDVVRFARKNKMKLTQVATTSYGQPLINMKGSHIDRAGFACDDMIAACYAYGEIKLQKFDPQKFGF